MTAAAKPRRPTENVWDYPRPPRLEATPLRLVVKLGETTIADTRSGYRVLETSHPPTYYLPPRDVKMEYLKKSIKSSYCEWKGSATYYDVTVPGCQDVESRVWSYDNPTAGFKAIEGDLSFYASPFNCTVDGEEVAAQNGDFYGGWKTSEVTGGAKGFKGGPGTWGW